LSTGQVRSPRRFPGSRPDHAAVGGTRPARRRSTATSITRHRYLRAVGWSSGGAAMAGATTPPIQAPASMP
jgi:hypothetical protein